MGVFAALPLLVTAFGIATHAIAAPFGSQDGPEPRNVDAVMEVLRQDLYDLELLISYGTSKGGSAGHLALAIRDPAAGDDIVYSANYYADRDPQHAERFYTDELMLRVPKKQYLFGTSSSLGDKASFGLDFGEIYKRSVIGVRVYGVPSRDKETLAKFFERINADYRNRVPSTEYHDDEIRYGYVELNCAKSIGAAFKYGVGYDKLEVRNAMPFVGRKLTAPIRANIPTEMAMKLMQEWDARGYGMDVVFYRKYAGSAYIEPRDEEPVAFKDLPNRFPSVLSRDFRREQGEYQDPDNLFAMYVFYNLAKYSVRIDGARELAEIERSKDPKRYADAARLALESARSDSDKFRRRIAFQPNGTRIGQEADPGKRDAARPD